MSGDVGADIAAVLAEHRKECPSEHCATCDCGWDMTPEQYAALDLQGHGWMAFDAYETHVADTLAPLVAVRVEAALSQALDQWQALADLAQREAKAEALREAADRVYTIGEQSGGVPVWRADVEDWLIDRAAALDPGPRP